MLQYSLLQRFQGAIVGSYLGDDRRPQFQPVTDWLCQSSSRTMTIHPGELTGQPSRDALQLTPLWLYCHDNWRQRQQWLAAISANQAAANQASTEPASPDRAAPDLAALWMWGETIAQVLRPQFQPQTCIPTLLDRWFRHSQQGAPALPAVWQQDLMQVQHWLQSEQGISEGISDCPTPLTAIDPDRRCLLVALFYFLATPTQSTIALTRTARAANTIPSDAAIACRLTGVLLGAHNGWQGFSTHQLRSFAPDILPATQRLATQLLRSWSGTLDFTPIATPSELPTELPPELLTELLTELPIVTAPR
jgi:hypothetical protein